MVLCSHMKDIKRGLSLTQFNGDPLAGAELSIGLLLLMRLGDKIDNGGLAVIC